MRKKFWAITQDGEILASMGAGIFFTKKEAETIASYIKGGEVRQVEVKIINSIGGNQ